LSGLYHGAAPHARLLCGFHARERDEAVVIDDEAKLPLGREHPSCASALSQALQQKACPRLGRLWASVNE
jgi:hypothetical protein